jgi:hypothetical protein
MAYRMPFQSGGSPEDHKLNQPQGHKAIVDFNDAVHAVMVRRLVLGRHNRRTDGPIVKSWRSAPRGRTTTGSSIRDVWYAYHIVVVHFVQSE